MTLHPKALLVLAGFGLLLGLSSWSGGGAWFHVAEAVTTVLILVGVAGLVGARVRGR